MPARKINLSKRTKDAIKRDFDTLPYDQLNREEQRYYNLVKAGKARQSTGHKFEGKFISKDLADKFEKVAERRGISVDEYLETNREPVRMLLERGFSVTAPKSHEAVIEVIENSRRKTVEISDGDGIRRASKMEAIYEVQALAQHAFSVTNIVVLLFEMKIYQTGKIQITIPGSSTYIDYIGESFTDFLNQFEPEIQFIQSDRKGNE